eukprot:jgi/Mesvir1/19875/Mv25386-RA.1
MACFLQGGKTKHGTPEAHVQPSMVSNQLFTAHTAFPKEKEPISNMQKTSVTIAKKLVEIKTASLYVAEKPGMMLKSNRSSLNRLCKTQSNFLL